jgi:hypothetical protein
MVTGTGVRSVAELTRRDLRDGPSSTGSNGSLDYLTDTSAPMVPQAATIQ